MQKKSYKPYSTEGGNGRVYTEEEVQAMIKKEVDSAVKSAKVSWDKDTETRIANERDDAARMASMSADERARAELNKREAVFAEEKEKYQREKMEFEATKALANENLPVSFAGLLSGADMEATAENISIFKAEFLKAIENALNERLKGKTPKTSSVVECNDPFLSGFGI